MTKKSYTEEDEEFVRFVRTTHTIAETAQLTSLSQSTVKRILAKSKSSVRPDQSEPRPNQTEHQTGWPKPNQFSESSVSPDEMTELRNLVNAQAKAIDRLNKYVFKRDEYEEDAPVTKLVLGKK